jgi:hypothetical protein
MGGGNDYSVIAMYLPRLRGERGEQLVVNQNQNIQRKTNRSQNINSVKYFNAKKSNGDNCKSLLTSPLDWVEVELQLNQPGRRRLGLQARTEESRKEKDQCPPTARCTYATALTQRSTITPTHCLPQSNLESTVYSLYYCCPQGLVMLKLVE